MLTHLRHCCLHGRLVSLRQDPTHLHYRVIWPEKTVSLLTTPSSVAQKAAALRDAADDTEDLLRSYFNLQLSLPALYEQWSKDDANFRKKAPKFSGIRILNQDAWEALVAFICSSNNNISRISQMVHKLCANYGPLIGYVGGQAFHDFPCPERLVGSKVESHLRELGFGYRAKYIADTARIVCEEKPPGWLLGLRNPASPAWGCYTRQGDRGASYRHAHEQLLTLTGVGPKVADCVCLMGLGWGEAVPVDTHVWQIAVRDYKFKGGKSKPFSKVLHDSVGDHFRQLWGPYAGWAQSVLFTANLKAFSDRLVDKEEDGVVQIKQEEITVEEPSRGRRKRKTRIVETKIEGDDEDVKIAAVVATRLSKRKRTRS